MRINVYTEELMPNAIKPDQPLSAEIVTAEYISSRTDKPMTNYGLRIYLKSHPDLHYVPPRDDDRSAITFWCGDSNRNILQFLALLTYTAEQFNLEHHRNKVIKAAKDTEIAEAERCMAPNAGGIGTTANCPGEECRTTGKCQVA